MSSRLEMAVPKKQPEERPIRKTAENKAVDLFEKCWTFTRADEIKAQGYYPYFRPIEENEGPVVTIEGRKIIMAGSNNYLGLTSDPRVKQAAVKAVEKYGTGCSGSRYLTGTLDLHIKLEERLAHFFGKESCLLYSTGYQTAQGIIPTLVQKGEYVVSDRDNHACIVAGNLMAKGAFAEFVRYKHNDMGDLERVMQKLPYDVPKLVVSDGVFSTSGTIVDLPNLVAIAKRYNARVLIDDAHAVGVIGKGGRGTASYFGLESEVDMTMGTFSKTFSSLGGFVVADKAVINYLKHHAPALIFSASPTPASVAAALASLDILEREPERIQRLIANAEKMRKGFKAMGFTVIDGQTAIVPVIIGDDLNTFIFWRELFDAGVFVNAFISPGVPNGMQMLRTSYMATHEDHHLNKILETFGTIGKKLGVIH
jgi:8-amino-7-oxononanoate synthase